MDTSLLYYIWLSTKLYPGSVSAKLLLETLSIDEIYHADRDEYTSLGIGHGDAERLCDKDLTDAKRYLEYCEKEHIGLLTYDNPYYPGRLKAINDPPPLFYYRGRVELLDDYPCFAMVGTRSCSEHGFRTAYRISYAAAACGGVVINGLALGSDTACMKGALDAGGYAVGLLGCGIDRIYPSQNKELFYRLSRQGLILSEFSPFTRPEGRNFPVRNRIISGLSVAAVIFEANAGSGALITASHALSQGRRIFAVPGDVGDKLYDGPLGILKDGAQMVTEAADFLTEYSLMFPHRIKVNDKVQIPQAAENAAVAEAFSVLENNAAHSGERHLPKPRRVKDPDSAKKARSKPMAEKTLSEEVKSSAPTAERPPETKLSRAEAFPPVPNMELSAEEKRLLSFFDNAEVLTVDEIAAKGMKTDDILSSLTLLEVFGYVRSLPGGRYEKQ